MKIRHQINWGIAVIFVMWICLGAVQAAQPPKRYAIIIANNHSRDEGVARLSFADDDGAKFFELFSAVRARVVLFGVLDADAQKKYPAAAQAARPPRQRDVLAAVEQLFADMQAARARGHQTHFYFVYSGHGNLGPNQEGYLNLLDARLRRSELYRQVLARSPASFNHLILDACHAYYLVNKRGGKPDKQGDYRNAVRDFLRAEELSSYPNTGIILATSSNAESHEWSRWEAGIFSHELRGALMGAGDVDGDGQVTYAEAAACVEAANAAIEDPKARLRVYYRAPASQVDVPLFEPADLVAAVRLQMAPKMAGRYHIEDARGVRTVDLHSSAEQPVHLALLGQAPFFLRTRSREARINQTTAEVQGHELVFVPRSAKSKGSLEVTFRRWLYRIPFGLGFFQGHGSVRQGEVSQNTTVLADVQSRPLKTWGWIGLGSAAVAGAAGAVFYYLADQAHDEYYYADDLQTVRDLRRKIDQHTDTAYVLWGTAGALVLTGVTLLILDTYSSDLQGSALRPALNASEHGLTFGFFGRW